MMKWTRVGWGTALSEYRYPDSLPLLGEGCKMSTLNSLIPEIPSSSNSLDFLTSTLSPLFPFPQSNPTPALPLHLPFGLS